MWIGFFYIIVIAVAVWGILTGYRRGFMRQIPGWLGVAFGIVAARMIAPDFCYTVDGWLPANMKEFNRQFVCDTLSYGLVYLAVAAIVTLVAFPLKRIIGILGEGVLDSIAGAVFRVFQYLMILSIVYNLLVDLNPSGGLTRSSSLHDGNVVEGVMKLAPAVLGFPGAEEVAYRQQLEDAKKIS